MRLIKIPTLISFWRKHADAKPALARWASVVRSASWRSLDDTRMSFPHADEVAVASGGVVTVFNVKGNTYRLVVAIHYNRGVVFVRDFMPHAEYSKNTWKGRH
jgi:mRNA interferase HigB